jgi:hypothetical protein
MRKIKIVLFWVQALQARRQAEQEVVRLRKEVEACGKEKRQLQGRVGQLAREARESTSTAEAAKRQAGEQQQQLEQLTMQCAAKEAALSRYAGGFEVDTQLTGASTLLCLLFGVCISAFLEGSSILVRSMATNLCACKVKVCSTPVICWLFVCQHELLQLLPTTYGTRWRKDDDVDNDAKRL